MAVLVVVAVAVPVVHLHGAVPPAAARAAGVVAVAVAVAVVHLHPEIAPEMMTSRHEALFQEFVRTTY